MDSFDPSSEMALLVRTLVEGHTDADDEANLLRLLGSLPADELNVVLQRVDLENLFDSVDNRVFGPDNADKLIELLTRTRLAELEPASVAAVIHGMQSGRTSPAQERAIRDVLLSFSGHELTALKNALGDYKDRHDLEGLLYYGIDQDEVRQQILDHFAASVPDDIGDEVKVLCDIDDTVFCKLHDERYPKGVVYPGILALLDALDDGPDGEPYSRGDLSFITARPGDVFGLIETHSRSTLRKAGIADLDLLGGTFRALLGKRAMAKGKVANIVHYREMFPEYHVMFIGDSGQGDPLVGEQIHEQFGDIKLVLIHDVVVSGDEVRDAAAAKHVTYIDTYVGGAVVARELGLISDAGLQHVIDESVAALATIPWESDGQRAAIEELIQRDIDAAVSRFGVRPPA